MTRSRRRADRASSSMLGAAASGVAVGDPVSGAVGAGMAAVRTSCGMREPAGRVDCCSAVAAACCSGSDCGAGGWTGGARGEEGAGPVGAPGAAAGVAACCGGTAGALGGGARLASAC